MIRMSLLRFGYDNGVARVDKNPNGSGLVFFIGEHWFNFGGETTDSYDDPQKYLQDFTEEEILSEALKVLDAFFGENWDEVRDEYNYYEEVLREARSRSEQPSN